MPKAEKNFGSGSKLGSVRVSAQEKRAAREAGISRPELGVPDHEAIRNFFGFEIEDLSDKSTNTIPPWKIKRHPGLSKEDEHDHE